jgi:serine/threonine protein kinase/formylglycine-generating enzyme required for sulfatase activity
MSPESLGGKPSSSAEPAGWLRPDVDDDLSTNSQDAQTNLSEAPRPVSPPACGKNIPASLGRYRVMAVLGKGSFGFVYKASDDQLRREVAIKVPRRERVATLRDAEAYLVEARLVASLDHPNIVPVLDVGCTDDGLPFVVSKLIDGSDLRQQMKAARPSLTEAAKLVMAIAGALHYAHRKELVHRDIKPANIVLDRNGKPYVADFGVALTEEDFGKESGFAGTPSYMSPEQAKGEGHRVDGRSDIFSLGVVFYELLTGRLPFRGEKVREVLDLIVSVDPKPPRQVVDGIPKELERICLKALAKRASERYTTAEDMADDIRHWLRDEGRGPTNSTAQKDVKDQRDIDQTLAQHPPFTTHPSPLTRIVPKGLRSFDAGDADFFLELLPGPRDRDGLPESIRFCKTRIEETDPDKTFAVGLIYGPSGCGKSSLVKAGLLPRLGEHVMPIYVEATADETEARLLKALRKQFPSLASGVASAPRVADGNLVNALTILRRGPAIPPGKKVLIVLDQFEQWLHAKREDKNTQLVQALRQCDAERVQCILMVRDDFWLAVSRFMTELEIDIIQGQNTALVDLFDLRHAKTVLRLFGESFGTLMPGETLREQDVFLEQAVSGLSQDGKVICVRLALFAEMVKGKPWRPATLKEVGGMEGVGVAFLEDTFSSRTAGPQHRLHQNAARSVLKALLPEQGSNIKGNMRSYLELVEASGYRSRARDFDNVMRILDSELRLITPTEPEAVLSASPVASAPGESGNREELGALTQPRSPERYYQLTHDYLVPSLREWLTRKQKETRRGRAELLLADRAGVWNARPENRQLPSLVQWLQIRRLTAKKNWTPPQRKMMRKAMRFHTTRAVTIAAVLITATIVGYDAFCRFEAQTLHNRLMDSTTEAVPEIVKQMAPYRRWTGQLLAATYAQAQEVGDGYKQLHASLALLPSDPSQVDYLRGRLLSAEPHEVAVIREALLDHAEDLTTSLWALLANQNEDSDRRFRAACALARYMPDDGRWAKVSDDIACTLVGQNPVVIAKWIDALRPVGESLLTSLADILQDEKRSDLERSVATRIYAEYSEGTDDSLAPLRNRLAEIAPQGSSEEVRAAVAKRQTYVAVALFQLGHYEAMRAILKQTSDPSARSFLIHRLGPSRVEPKALAAKLASETDVSIRRALILSLGELDVAQLPPGERDDWIASFLRLYRDDPDGGIHGAVEWLLRRWNQQDQLILADKQLASGVASAPRDSNKLAVPPSAKADMQSRWYINGQGQTMIIVPRPGEFTMGEGTQSVPWGPGARHKEKIDWSFAIASKPVTVEQFLRFRKDHRYNRQAAPTADCPVNSVSWYDAVAYCNWLSEQEVLTKDQWCYEPTEKAQPAPRMKAVTNWRQRMGYRLPTEAEWEYACRAGTTSSWSFGDVPELVDKYEWTYGLALQKSHPVGVLKPNELGAFDMHGNVWNWCQDSFENRIEDSNVVRGGGFMAFPELVRSAFRGMLPRAVPDNPYVGFRPARTFR